MTARLTRRAAQDIDQILDHTLSTFGIAQFRRYQELIDGAMRDIAEFPLRPGSKSRPEIAERHRSWHIQLTGKRIGSASHIVFYFCLTDDPQTDIVILRVLHERMDPQTHIG